MSSNYIVAWLVNDIDWIVKYGFSSHEVPFMRIRDAEKMLSENGFMPVARHVTHFPQTKRFEKWVHGRLSHNLVHGIHNGTGGFSRETFCLNHQQLAQLLRNLNLDVPMSVARRLIVPARISLASRPARGTPSTLPVARKPVVQLSLWERLKRRLAVVHARLSERPRTWVLVPPSDVHPAGERVELVSHYVGRDCNCGHRNWFDARMGSAKKHVCPKCRCMVESIDLRAKMPAIAA